MDEKWLKIIGNIFDESRDDFSTDSKIKLLEIKARNDASSNGYNEYAPHRKSKRKSYFIKDQQIELDDADINHQLSNTKDIQLLSANELRFDQKSAKNHLDNLLKDPQRNYPSSLLKYFTKNLIIPSKCEDDFIISYDEIEKDVYRIRSYRLESNKTLPIDHGGEWLANHSDRNETFDQKESDKNESLISSQKHTILTAIDSDFKPKIVLSTKSYRRK
ncbi:hypothetical protein SSS_07145 [Sarcoptes scabiei]|nr:hypothetical protein SSS_07145 [Sarcoptes scabiei]